MESKSFLDWLFSEAGAGWIFGIVSLIGFLLSLLLRKRPNRLVCKEVNRTSLIKIRKEVRDNIDVTFCKEHVKNLALVEMVIFNKGSDVIRDILLTVKFLKDTKVLSASLESVPENLEVTTDFIESNQAKIKIPFLNPIRPHKHRIKAIILCDGDIQKYKVIGSGEGWSVQLLRIPNKKESKRKFYIMSGIIFITFLLSTFVYSPFVERHWGIPYTEISLRAFLIYLPVILIIFATFLWGLKYVYWLGQGMQDMTDEH
jgi:hypothetical protein